MDKINNMSLRPAMQLLENLDKEPKLTSEILAALNAVINSPDISHMSRKGLYMGLRYMVENLDSLAVHTDK